MENGRDYLETHGHIDFSLDLRDLLPEAWVLMGEAKSKAQHVGRSLLAPEVSHQIMQVYLAKGALATTAIEGNTLSEKEAEELLEGSLDLPPSKQYLASEIKNVLTGFNKVKDELLAEPEPAWTVHRICEFNRILLSGLAVEDHVVPGQIREESVGVASYLGPPHTDCEYLLGRLCDWLNGADFATPQESALGAPLAIIKAVVAHLYIAWIHPFGDGNGRTARLMELQILLAAGFPAPTCQLLSNHYNQTRSEYYRVLRNSSKSKGRELEFVGYAIRGFADQLRDQLKVITERVTRDRWEQFIYQRSSEKRGETAERRRRLALELSAHYFETGVGVSKKDLPLLTPRLAAAYAQKTGKTLTRDLNAIVNLELIREVDSRWIPKIELLRELSPASRHGVLWQDDSVDL